MTLPDAAFLADLPGRAFSFVMAKLVQLFLLPGTFSLASLLCALCLAVLYLGMKRRGRRPLRPAVLVRALFPRRLLRSASARADVLYFFFSFFLAGLLIGWAVLSYHLVSANAHALLVHAFGATRPTALAGWQTAALLTLALFLAYEFAYWIDHYLSHNVPVLWEFHKVHHTAEVLSPLTNFRVHPIDTLVFNNISALMMGLTGALVNYGLGVGAEEFTVANSNVLILAFAYLLQHLQHSHFWIAFTGIWGRLFLSPAHHQVHHSTDPVHFNKNLGSCLGIWDWLFGTLHVPSARREPLRFGVEPNPRGAHSLPGSLLWPMREAWMCLMRRSVRPQPDAQPPATQATASRLTA